METIHQCPKGDARYTPCCGKLVNELSWGDRITSDSKLVTCKKKS